ncbi:hypothetical protein BGZ98_005966 [Dissophora globulifera]|nr:hypothetical protein BGZ98_005966 [Dissophora globulifera]
MTSPLDLPEILGLVASYLETKDLARACRVSVLFHNACTPALWHTINLGGNRANRVWHDDEGFRLGLTQYGPYIRTLRLRISEVRDEDMEIIAANCTRLKSLNLMFADITVDNLRILLHSDPYKISPGSTENSDVVDINTRMERYRRMTLSERETDQNSGHHLYDNPGVPASFTESEQEQHQLTGPVLAPEPPYTFSRARLITPGRITAIQGRTNRPSKFKDTKIQFPFHLEELNLSRCRPLYGPKLFPVLALLGPQLRSLSLDGIAGITDVENPSGPIQLLKHCPNLTRLGLASTDIDDNVFTVLAGSTNELAPRAMEMLNLNRTSVSTKGLMPLVKVSRDKMEQLWCPENAYINDDVIYAFIEDAKKLSKAAHPVRPFVRNEVLSVLRLNESVDITHKALLELFHHTTALTIVALNGMDVRNDVLEALASANRSRMERLGLGIPEAWYQHEQGTINFMAKTIAGKRPITPKTVTRGKLYDGAWVPGGLQSLSLENCISVTNQGVRAIVRSHQYADPELDRGMLLEERIEDERFPMTLLPKTHPSDDFREDGQYDYMISPMSMHEEDALHVSYVVDEDGPVQEDTLDPTNSHENLFPAKAYRNHDETRRTLNEFYRKLEQFDQLIFLDMAKSDYRIRIQDGLNLVLPALTKNLRYWNMCRSYDYILQNAELEWFGKHFGYGFDFSGNENKLNQEHMISPQHQSFRCNDDTKDEWDEFFVEFNKLSGMDPNRVSKLRDLYVCKNSFEWGNVDKKLYEWFKESGFSVHLLSDIDATFNFESDSRDEWDSEGELDSLDEE